MCAYCVPGQRSLIWQTLLPRRMQTTRDVKLLTQVPQQSPYQCCWLHPGRSLWVWDRACLFLSPGAVEFGNQKNGRGGNNLLGREEIQSPYKRTPEFKDFRSVEKKSFQLLTVFFTIFTT